MLNMFNADRGTVMIFGIRTTAKDSLILTEPKKTVKHLKNLCLYPVI